MTNTNGRPPRPAADAAFDQAVGRKVRTLLVTSSTSQAELARRVGIPQNVVSRLLTGERSWKLATAVRVASALDQDVTALLD